MITKRTKGVVSSMGIRYGFLISDADGESYFISKHQMHEALFQSDRVSFIPCIERKHNNRKTVSRVALDVEKIAG